VEREGFNSFRCVGMDEAGVLSNVREFDFSWLNERSLEGTFQSQVSVINAYRPLAVLGDAVPSLKMAAEYAGVKFISLMNGYMSRYYACSRSLPTSHPAYPYLSGFPNFIKDFLTATGEAFAFRKIHRPFESIRHRYKLGLVRNFLEEMAGDYNLVCDLPELFPQRWLPAGYGVIGPLIYEGLNEAGDVSERLLSDRKTIVVSMGSTGDWDRVAFLNDRYFDRYNIIAAGDSNGVLSASHIQRVGFISAKEVLSRADLVICHGGNGTIYQALAYGVPLLCVPVHFEQEWNVAGLEKMGLGRAMGGTVDGGLIEEWVDRKKLAVYVQVRDAIERSVLQISQKIREMLYQLFPASTVISA